MQGMLETWFNPWVRKIPWRRAQQPTPVFLPGESHGQRSLVGYSPRGRRESDTTERLHFHGPDTALGFPDISVGKESACNAGDPGLTPGSGKSPGEGIGYPLQYSWSSLVAQMVKNLPEMQETWVQSLG